MLRGRCRHCHTKISPRYPLVETFTALVFLATYAQFGFTWYTLGYCLFLAWLIALSAIDLDTMTLPNPLTSSGLVLGLVFQAGWGYQQNPTIGGATAALIGAIGGAVLGIWLYDGIQFFGSLLLGRVAQGGGDAKLMGMVGAWLGWQGVLLTGALASFSGTLLMGGAMVLGLLGRGQKFPLGPFLAGSAAIALFTGGGIIRTYQNIMTNMDRSTNLWMTGVMFVVLVLYLIYVRRSRAQRG
jgi:leader peptidase (prepilin peptidase) / N-methyltransferase